MDTGVCNRYAQATLQRVAPPTQAARIGPMDRSESRQRPKPNSQSKRCRYDERVGTTVGNGDGRRIGE